NSALLRVDEQHPARTKTVLIHNVFCRNFYRASFGAQNNMVVLRHVVTGWTKAVAVQYGADLRAVGEAHSSRAVPRLHQRAVVLVERFALLVHVLVAGPWLRNHHHRYMRQRTSR